MAIEQQWIDEAAKRYGREDGKAFIPCSRCGGTGKWYYRSIYGVACFLCQGHKGYTLSIEEAAKKLRDAHKRRVAKEKRFQARKMAWKLEGIAKARVFLSDKPDLRIALAKAPKGDPRRDMAAKLVKWGSLSEKQIAFALRLNQPKPAEAQKCDIPVVAQRVDIVGVVLSIKEGVDFRGYIQPKMLVEVACEAGVYRIFGSVPAAILDDVKRGSIVRFSAVIERKEFGFGFFSRPTKAEIIAQEGE